MAASKDHVRELYNLKRQRIPESSRNEMDKKICEGFFNTFNLREIKAVHTYLPIKEKIEVDTWPIVNRLISDYPQIRIIIPFTVFTDHILKHYYWKSGNKLIKNQWGIDEPDPDSSEEASIHDIDLVIVPLLAFDLKGHRVGYGAGYYDRFLGECSDDTLKVGVSHFAHEDQWIQSENYDIDLDYCITPDRVYQF